MEFSVQFCQVVMRYWKKRTYQRLEGSNKKNHKIVRLGDKSPRGTWKVRPSHPRLRLRICSPIKVLGRLKDAYMNNMLKLAGTNGSLQGGNTFGAKRIPRARTVKESSKDFEIRMILEVCKSIAASRQAAV